MPVYRRALVYFRPFLAPTIGATLLTLVTIGFNLLKPWPFAFLVDKVLPGGREQGQPLAFLGVDVSGFSAPALILILCALIVLFHFLAGLMNLAATLVFVRVGLQALLRLRTELYAYLQRCR